MTGHIKLDRKIMLWEWYQDINTCRLFIHLLLMANHTDGQWQGYKIGRGQLITGLNKLSEKTGLSIRQLRTSFNKLLLTGEITIKTTNKFRVVTICKYDTYQSKRNSIDNQIDKQNEPKMSDKRQTERNQTTTNNNEEEYNNEEISNRGEGDFASPSNPAEINGFNYLPDGRSYIEPTSFFTKADFNGLPNEKNEEVRRFLKVTKNIEIEESEINELWKIFKEMELTFQKPYRNKDDVYRHFLNYTKKQSFSKTRKPKEKIISKKQSKEVRGIKFINDFKECEMSDGSVRKLTTNESDAAKFNQLSANSIK